jgi:prevent-host-death family protein
MFLKFRNFRILAMSDTLRVSATEFQKEIGRYADIALTRPVTVTRNGRDRTVLISAEEYQRLKRRDRQVMGLADFDDTDLDAIARAEAPEAAAAFDSETR